jgi:hypothetical protein
MPAWLAGNGIGTMPAAYPIARSLFRNAQSLTWQFKQLPLLKQRFNFFYRQEIAKHQPNLPLINLQQRNIVKDLLTNHIPQEYWQTCTGPKNSVVLIDTCKVFHRAKPPENQDRYSITFHYTSQLPLMTFEHNYFADNPKIRKGLSTRQLQCIYRHK